jgi:hypothetical protein
MLTSLRLCCDPTIFFIILSFHIKSSWNVNSLISMFLILIKMGLNSLRFHSHNLHTIRISFHNSFCVLSIHCTCIYSIIYYNILSLKSLFWMALQIYIPIHKSINDELFFVFFSKIPFIIPKPIKSHKDIRINNFDAVWLNFIDSSHSFSRVIYILTNQVGYTQKKKCN